MPPSKRPTRRRSYHHGDLRAALIDTALELIAEQGVQAFSMAEASRRLGVAVSAPYRHFADRDELLLAVGARAGELLVAAVTAERGGSAPEDRLVAVARGYVRFAARHRALFEVLFGSWSPEMERASQPVKEAFQSGSMALAGGDPVAAESLGMAVAATAHGHAGLLHLGAFGTGEQAVDRAVRHAAAATLALIAGRARLTPSGDSATASAAADDEHRHEGRAHHDRPPAEQEA